MQEQQGSFFLKVGFVTALLCPKERIKPTHSGLKISLGSSLKASTKNISVQITTGKGRTNSLLKHELKSSSRNYNLSISSHFHKLFLYADSNYLKGSCSLLQSSLYNWNDYWEKSWPDHSYWYLFFPLISPVDPEPVFLKGWYQSQEHQYHPGTCLKCIFWSPTLDPPNQKL